MSIVSRLTREVALTLGGVAIRCNQDDGYINATELCAAGHKQLCNWNTNKKSEQFLKVLSVSLGIPSGKLHEYRDKGPLDRGTWAHPQVAINIAQWISPEFDVQVSKWIHELLVFGNVKYGMERSDVSIMHEQLKQLENTVSAKDGIIVVKDEKIDYLTQLITNLGYDMQGMRLENKEIKDTLDKAHKDIVKNTIILEDISKRCVPKLVDTQLIEAYCLMHIKEDKYYSIRVQKRSINSAIKRYNSLHRVALRTVKIWDNAPNAVMFHLFIQDTLEPLGHITISENIIKLHSKCTEDSLVRKINRLYALKY
jgi:hypothetical protein